MPRRVSGDISEAKMRHKLLLGLGKKKELLAQLLFQSVSVQALMQALILKYITNNRIFSSSTPFHTD